MTGDGARRRQWRQVIDAKPARILDFVFLHDDIATGIFGMEADEETIPTFDYIVKKVSDEYNLAYLHLSEPFNDVSDKPYLVQEIAKHYRPMYKGTLMINGGFDQEKGNKFIEEGLADLVSYAKYFISNPDLPKRFELNAPLAEWDEDTFYTPGPEGYTDYHFLGESEVNKEYG